VDFSKRGFSLFKPERLIPSVVYLQTVLFAALLIAARPASAQSHNFPFRATNYDVQVIIHPENQTISALAKVDFVANEVGRTVLVELHPDLQISSVKDATGHQLTFGRDGSSPLLVSVGLLDAATPGKPVTLNFEYSGPVSSEDDSPTRGTRLASVDKTSAYLLLPARWFPLTNYPSNRYTGTFKVVVPDTFAVTGTGKAESPVTMPSVGKGFPSQISYVFRNTTPGPVGTFVAGALQLSPVQTEGYPISVYTPPAQASSANSYANSLARIMGYLSETFGALDAQPSLTIAQMPDGSLSGFSAPGLLLISAHQWTPKANDRLLSQLAAGQWWGNNVLPATASDTWITDGLSRYSEALYAEQSDGVAGLHKALEDFAVGALMYEDTTPISQASHLGLYSDQYRSIVADKGALVFHMLRSEIGDDNFTALLKEFYKQHAGNTATVDQFEKLSATKIPPAAPGEEPVNLLSFFSQWLNSTGVPEFQVSYVVYRTPKGFQVVGKIHQDLDTFRMPVEIRVDTEGNPETAKILVTGTDSQFEVDTFGRPKPGGVVIDPNNNLLKSSPALRIRAAVGRGEAQAAIGKYFEAIQEYQRALDMQANNSLAQFRMGEALFYQKNYQAAANSFRSALNGDLNPKWVEVWSHIYIGEIYDLLGQRERAVNEYSLAQHTRDDTAGAQAEAGKYLQKAYGSADTVTAGTTAGAAPGSTAVPPPAAPDNGNVPVLKRREN
jgi:Peptidase family M1 domain